MKTVSSYKKSAYLIILLLSTLVIFTGCVKHEQIEDDSLEDIPLEDMSIEDIPSLQLVYIGDDRTETITVPRGTASWRYKDRGIESDAPHPLDAVGSIAEIIKTEDLLEIKLDFSSQPTSYTVRCWTLEYIQNNEAYDNFYEEVEITNDTLTVPNDEAGYIYLIHAFWSQGNVYYGFNVFNSAYRDNDSIPENIAENENIKNTDDIII